MTQTAALASTLRGSDGETLCSCMVFHFALFTMWCAASRGPSFERVREWPRRVSRARLPTALTCASLVSIGASWAPFSSFQVFAVRLYTCQTAQMALSSTLHACKADVSASAGESPA